MKPDSFRETNRGEQRYLREQKILNDVRDEPHYALGGLVLGALVGAIVRVVV